MDRVFDTAMANFYLNKDTAPLLNNIYYRQADKILLVVYIRKEEDLNGEFI